MTGQEIRGLEIPDPQVQLDVEYLRQLGPNPRLVLETDRGTLRILLAPDEAPLTVQTIARYAEAGHYDGVIFHRVIGNFVAQAGDFSAGDGSGGPGLAIRSELTRIPFRRGVIGMASSGRDTEESQFFVTHSMQPHLDGSIDEGGQWQAYTAFGWLEEGENALDQLMEGDRIVSATVERDDGAES
ncbi:MAG: peptidylprolyl isomerase [Gemmatimonadales bacterium]|nr:MAG: peptidylprolyl isomerase [Gemmatimonadales bacterium]